MPQPHDDVAALLRRPTLDSALTQFYGTLDDLAQLGTPALARLAVGYGENYVRGLELDAAEDRAAAGAAGPGGVEGGF